MRERTLRPWGVVGNLMPRLQSRPWHFIGCVAAEDRSTGARWALQEAGVGIASECWFRIDDGPNRFSARTTQKLALREKELAESSWRVDRRVDLDLLCPHDEIVDGFDGCISLSAGSLLIDISSFPKRFFFPLVRMISANRELRDVVYLYSVAERYGELPISEDIEALDALPLFAPIRKDQRPDVLILAAGLQALGVLELTEAIGSADVQLLMPTSSSAMIRAALLRFQKSIESDLSEIQMRPIQFLSPVDSSSAFTEILRKVGSDQSATLAPFGPKPISLAMALAASVREWPVYYSQPKVYNPDYSIGVASNFGMKTVYAYVERANGVDFYR